MLFDGRCPFFLLFGASIWFSYIVVTFSWNLHFDSLFAELAFTNLLAAMLWQPLEIMGTHFLFWSWHNDEPLMLERYGKVPVVSSMWIMSLLSSFQLLVTLYKRWHQHHGNGVDRFERMGHSECMLVGSGCGVLGIVFMNIPFNLVYHPLSHWMSSNLSVVNLYQALSLLIVLFYGFKNASKIRLRFSRKRVYFDLVLQVLMLYGWLSTMLMAQFEDLQQYGFRSDSYHQTLGEAQIVETSFWGIFKRNKFVINYAVNPETDNYDFRCLQYDSEILPLLMANHGELEWYPLCINGLDIRFIKEFYILMFLGIFFAIIAQFVTFDHDQEEQEKEKEQ